jgi:hypothetical protein
MVCASRYRWLSWVAAISVLIIVLSPARPLEGQFAIQVNVARVSLDVEVSDSAGRPVTNLTRDDFQVFEDGRHQGLLYFGVAD